MTCLPCLPDRQAAGRRSHLTKRLLIYGKNWECRKKESPNCPRKIIGGDRPAKPDRAGRIRKCFTGLAARIKFRTVSTTTTIYGWKFGTMFLCNTTKAKTANIIL